MHTLHMLGAPAPQNFGHLQMQALLHMLAIQLLHALLRSQDVVQTLQQQAKIEPGFTTLVWSKLEEQNPEFFKAYYLRCAIVTSHPPTSFAGWGWVRYIGRTSTGACSVGRMYSGTGWVQMLHGVHACA